MVSRFPGSVIIGYESNAFDEHRLGIRKATETTFTEQNSRRVEGKLTNIIYRLPLSRSTLEVFDSYKRALTGAGFSLLFQCKGRACGFTSAMTGKNRLLNVIAQDINGDTDSRYLSASRKSPDGDVYISVFTLGGEGKILTRLTVVEARPMDNGLISINAQSMGDAIRSAGRVALYGINFDTDKTEPTAASMPMIAEIARLLKNEPSLKLLIVGHTDRVGPYAYNLDLSKRRAEAITSQLVNQLQIQADRLQAIGVGYASPIATNRTDEGKAKNRRVELVEQ